MIARPAEAASQGRGRGGEMEPIAAAGQATWKPLPHLQSIVVVEGLSDSQAIQRAVSAPVGKGTDGAEVWTK